MDNAGTAFGELIEKAQNTTAQTIKGTVSDTAHSVQSQFGMGNDSSANIGDRSQQSGDEGFERTKEMVSDYYAPSDYVQTGQPQDSDAKVQLANARKELQKLFHKEYYEALESQSVPHSARQPEEVKGPQIVEEQELPELGTLGSPNEKDSSLNRPFALAARRAMIKVENPMSLG